MEYKIYSQAGTLKTSFSPGTSTHTHEAMVENILNLSFTLNEFISLEVNDYIDIDTDRFTLIEAYKPVIKNKRQYQYDVKFYGAESIAKNAQLVDENYEPITSYYDTPAAQLQYIVNCINRVVGSNRYSVGAVVSSAAILVEYSSGSNCFQALTALANAAETEWWMDGTSFNLTKCEHGEIVSLGYGEGLTSLDKEVSDDNEFFTRLIPLGSTKNIVKSTYGYKRLQLPNGAKFVDNNVSVYGVKEHIEEKAFADIYPRFTGAVGTVRTEVKTIEGTERTVYYFTDTTMGFNPNDYVVAELVKHIVFKSGDLIAQDFEANWYPATGEWEIINQYPDESTQVPGGYVIPRTGDTYTIYNIEMPAIYRTNAEAELLAAVQTYLAKYAIDFSIYKGATDHVHLEENNITLTLGRRVKLLSDEYFTSGSRDSRITKITRKLSDLNQMDIEVSNVILKGSYAQLKDDVSNLKTRVDEQISTEVLNIIKSFQVGDLTDDNVLSSLRVLKEIKNRALSRTLDDTAAGLIDYLKGIKINGNKGSIDENGYANFKRLILDEFLEVPELRYNKTTVNPGISWNAPGGGIIESVDTVNKVITLKLEDGELGAIDVDDICMGIFHSLTSSENATANSDDGKGNIHVAGFATVYFKVISILEGTSNNKKFVYELRPGYTVEPSMAMNFAAYGNFTKASRQTSRMETRTYRRYLVGVNNWEITKDNIAAQDGDLSNLEILGLPSMTGYSSYLNNIYITGTINQIETNYTWIAWANDAAGTDFSTTESADRKWIGFAYNKGTATPSQQYTDYKWTLIKGSDGATPVTIKITGNNIYKYPKGSSTPESATITLTADVQGLAEPTYNWGYVVNGKFTSLGSFTKTRTVNVSLLGAASSLIVRCYTNEGEQYDDFTLYKLYDGNDGAKGDQGVAGIAGTTYYTWIKYADDADGNGMSDYPDGKPYIGLAYNKTTNIESTVKTDYSWSLIKGTDGQPGADGSDGSTLYTWIKYSDYSDGTSMYDVPTSNTKYIGLAVNKTTATESTVKTDYTWSKFKGEQGDQGVQGIPGTTFYTWIKYANDATGTGLSDYPDGKPYIGIAYNKTTATESTTASDYTWSLIKGTDGQPGAKGADGATLYTWIKYSDYSDGTGLYDVPTTSTQYIGLAVNKTTATESTVKTDYTWSKFKGEQGSQGIKGDTGATGAQGSIGRMPYPMGDYDSATTYTRDSSKCPFVKDGSAYYYLNADTSAGIKPSTDATGIWKAFNMLKWIFSEVLFSDFGKLASAIFSGDFMLSQQGTLNIPVFKWSYTSPSTPSGGSYTSPVPTGWSSTIPASTGGSLYYSIRKFNANGINQDDVWSTPVAMLATSSIKFLFSSVASPTDPNTDTTSWSSSVITGAYWFAVSTYSGGIWSSYVVTKVLSTYGYENFDGSSNANDAFIPNYFVNFLTGNFRAISGVVGLLQMISGAMIGRDTSGIERIRFSSGPIDSLSALTNSWESISEGALNDYGYMLVTNSNGFFTGYTDTAITEKIFTLDSPGNIKLINPVYNYSFSPSNYIISGSSSLKVSILDSSNNVVYGPTTNVTNSISLSAGTYKVRLAVDVDASGEGDSSTRYMFKYAVGFDSIESQKASTRTMIGSNGFYSMFGSNSYLYYRSDYGLQVRYGNFGFRILSDGIKYSNTMGNAIPTWSTLIR